MSKKLSQHLSLLKLNVDNLEQIEALIHLLRKSDFTQLEPCEIEMSLAGITSLLMNHVERLKERVALISEVANG